MLMQCLIRGKILQSLHTFLFISIQVTLSQRSIWLYLACNVRLRVKGVMRQDIFGLITLNLRNLCYFYLLEIPPNLVALQLLCFSHFSFTVCTFFFFLWPRDSKWSLLLPIPLKPFSFHFHFLFFFS